jgi:hypothetical protein
VNDQLMTVSAFVYVSPSSVSAVDCRLLYPAGLCIYRPSHRFARCSALIALLLLIGNVEPNPGPQCHGTISFGLLNARSAVYKAALIHDVISDHHLDVVAVTETWMMSDDPDAVKLDIGPDSYRVSHACRGSLVDTRWGSGVAVVHRESINVSIIDLGTFSKFEYLSVKLQSPNAPLQITSLYRQPGTVSSAFCDELTDLFDQLF